jgi:predicted nucleic acid-binding protein
MDALDTNVLMYAHDPRDPAKQLVAVSLIQGLVDGALLWQVACEYLSASRKLESLGYSRVQAFQDVRDLRSVWTTLIPEWDVLDRAESLLNTYSLSFWDAVLIAACCQGGVARLYSENFSGYSRIDGLALINPFQTP